MKIVNADAPNLAGAKVGEKILVKLKRGITVKLVYIDFNQIGLEGNNTQKVGYPLQFYPWSNIDNVTKDDEAEDQVLRLR